MSLNHFLTRLIWLSVLPLALLTGFLVNGNIRSLHGEFESRAQNLVRNSATSIDRQLRSRIRGLSMLATVPAAHEPSLKQYFYQAARSYQQNFDAHVILADRDAQMLFNTRLPENATLPKLPTPRPGGQAAFPRVLETGLPAVGDVVHGPIAGESLVAVAVPVKRGDSVTAVLLATLTGKLFRDYFDEMAIPEGWVLSLRDSTGELIARQASDVAGEFAAHEQMVRFTAQTQLAPWSVVLEIPESLHRAPLRNALLLLTLVTALSIVAAFFSGQVISRRLQKSIRALAEPPGAGTTEEKINEIAAVRRLIDESVDQRMRAESANQETQKRYIAQLEKVFMGAVEVATNLGELRDPFNAGHQRRAANLAAAIGAELGFDAQRQEGMRVAGFLYDIGKISVPAEILSRPATLNAAEFELVKQHCQASYDVLRKVEFPWPVAEAALQHHERMDGSGYPQGLKGEAILLEARILGIADVVEAMCSHRPYRPARGIDKALEEIECGRGTRYDAAVVGACVRLFREKGYQLPD